MKKTLIVIIILAIVVIAAKFTVPTEEKHHQVAESKLNTMISQKMSSFQGLKEIAQGQNMDLRTWIRVLANQMEVKDYFVCNVGRVTIDDTTYPLTIGVFNHVFVLTDYMDEIQKAEKKVEDIKGKF